MWLKGMRLLLLMTISLAAMPGCSIGLKEQKTTIFVTPVPIPEAAKGVVVVATNEPVPLGFYNKDGTFERDIGGYVVVEPQFYGLLVRTYKQARERD